MSTEKWLAILTGALVLVGFLQFWAMLSQRKWMRKNVGVADMAAQAAKASADAANDTVKLMRNTARRELRARVFVSSARRLSPPGPGPFDVEITIKNYGGVPAYKCTCAVALVPGTSHPDESTFPDPHQSGQAPNLPLPPNGEFRIVKNLLAGLSHTQDSQVGREDLAVYVYGEIGYRDGFSNDRFTKFRMKCSGIDYSPGNFVYCDKGNEAD